MRSALRSEGRQCGGSVPAILSWASINSSTVSGHRCELPTSTSQRELLTGRSSGRTGQHENAARDALQAAEIDYVQREAVTVRLQNVPGAGAATFRRLLEANVNLEGFLPVRMFVDECYAVICPDNVAAALAALGDQVVAT